jgi:outer membrane lipoprotein-sorting protein
VLSNIPPQFAGQAAPYISLQNLGEMENVQLVGTEPVNGVTTYHLHATGSQAESGQSVAYTENLWVSQSNYQPVKMMVQAQTSAGQLAATTTFSNWNGGQTITPPAVSEITNP